MKKLLLKMALVALAAAAAFPAASQAADADPQQKIDQLNKEMEELNARVKKEISDLKGQLKKTEDKSLGRWLSIGGDYRYRLDSLHGQTVPYTNAIDTMTNLVHGFTGATGVAGSGIGGITSPSAVDFIMQGQSGKLFTPDQFNTILNQYMPQAMAAQLPTMVDQFATGRFNLQNTTLTPQQQGILNTLNSKVLPIVMAMPVASVTGLSDALVRAGFPVPATVGALMNGLSPANQQLLSKMLMQAFLGQAGPLNGNRSSLALVPAFKPKNNTLQTNKFGLDLRVKATQDVTVNVKLNMYKTFGEQTAAATSGNFFADRVGVFDGTLGHVPSTGLLNVDRAYATWSNIAEQPVWFSVGRRPATNGAPNNLKLNNERPGNGGVPALLVDYAFDGMSLGYAPDIAALPGAYAKVCYGRAFESGFETPLNSIKDTDMLGVALVPMDTDRLRVWMQWNRAFQIFDFQTMKDTAFGNTDIAANIGSGDWYGTGFMSNIKRVGPGNLNFFSDFGMSVMHPNSNVSLNAGFEGLMTGAFFAQEAPSDKTGWAMFTGVRYDLPSKTKLGLEYNHGSKNWIPFAAASDDMWTGKLGTRGDVYEAYVIQELNLKPISNYLSKAFFKVGYQYYDYEYTGSNNWVGAPVKISSIQPTDLMLLAPVKKAQDAYLTFEVHF